MSVDLEKLKQEYVSEFDKVGEIMSKLNPLDSLRDSNRYNDLQNYRNGIRYCIDRLEELEK